MITRGETTGRDDVLAELGRKCARAALRNSRRSPGRVSVNGRVFSAAKRGRFFTTLPILGAVPAGRGDNSERVDLGTLPVDLEALRIRKNSRVFALRVRGDSMEGANIADGDIVIVDAREPRPGDIVAALIDGETTLKRFVARDGDVFLQAENPKYPDLIPLNELVVQGVVRAVVRTCDGRLSDA